MPKERPWKILFLGGRLDGLESEHKLLSTQLLVPNRAGGDYVYEFSTLNREHRTATYRFNPDAKSPYEEYYA